MQYLKLKFGRTLRFSTDGSPTGANSGNKWSSGRAEITANTLENWISCGLVNSYGESGIGF